MRKKWDIICPIAFAVISMILVFGLIAYRCFYGPDSPASSPGLSASDSSKETSSQTSSAESSAASSSSASSESSDESKDSSKASSSEESAASDGNDGEDGDDGDTDDRADGNGGGSGGGGGNKPSSSEEKVYNGPISVMTPYAGGTEVYGEDGTVIDASNSSQGYVMVKQDGYSSRLKCQVINEGTGETYNYDLNNQGWYEVFPLQMGSGTYRVSVLENIGGSSYLEISSGSFSVSLASSEIPFLYPNQRVWYTSDSSAVKKSYDLCVGAGSDGEKISAIYNYIINNISYDYGKASSVSSGYIPSPDSTLSSGSGICYDYAALMATMLRAQGIPARLVIGSASGSRHAWNMVYGQLYDPTFAAAGSSGSGYSQSQVF